MKAIETRYRGYRFRSRLEARWAVFFDALGIDWLYENEGYQIGQERYLPDFWLPTFCGGMFAEVKPQDSGDWNKAIALCKQSGKSVWLCEGVPSIRAWEVLRPSSDEVAFSADIFEEDLAIEIGIPNADQAEGDNRMFWCPGYEDHDLTIPDGVLSCLGDTFTKAVEAARSARFEHGETPCPK